MNYDVIAYYIFTEIQDPHLMVARQKEFFAGRDMTGRIYISHEGINAQLSGVKEDADAYIAWMRSDERFKDIDFKVHPYHTNAFAKMTVKYRKQLVALDQPVDLSMTGQHLSPAQWDQMLDQKDEHTLLIDVRNSYEWEVGHFKGAPKPELETFRAFKGYAQEIKESRDPSKTKVMMYCTGGIRCELYSCLLKEYGFDEVYQLDGGVIRYGLERGQSHWEGKLFVFDDRMVVPIAEGVDETLTVCQGCGTKADHYYNCANMDCNQLFIVCPACFEAERGCCCQECHSGRLRPISLADGGRPFRKLDKAFKQQLEANR
jgi:UPF0176 protein